MGFAVVMFGALGIALNPVYSQEGVGATWHVSLQGNDSSSGATPKNSLRTILAAVRKAQPGDTILLAPGTYGGGVVLKPGKPGKPITLRAETPGRTFLGRPALATGFEPSGGYTWSAPLQEEPEMLTELTTNSILRRLSTPAEVRELSGSWCYDKSARRLTIHATDSGNATAHLFMPSAPLIGITLANHTRVEGLALSGFGDAAIFGKEIKDAEVRGCTIHANGYGIHLRGAEDCRIVGNRLWQNSPNYADGGQIHITAPHARRVEVVRNTIHDGPRFGGRFYSSGPTEDCLLEGNLVWGNDHGGLFFKGGAGKNQIGRFNVSIGNRNDDFRSQDGGRNTYGTIAAGWQDQVHPDDLVLGKGRAALAKDWKFADPSYFDYRLQADSPARGAAPDGTDLGAHPYGGSVLFVAPDGDDANEGTSRAKAWKTLAHAASKLAAGQTLYIAPGDWNEPLAVSNLRSTAEGPARIRILGKARTTFPGIRVEASEHLVLEDLVACGANAKITITRSSNIRLERCISELAEPAPAAPPEPPSESFLSKLLAWFRKPAAPPAPAVNAAVEILGSPESLLDHCAIVSCKGPAIAIANSPRCEVVSSLFLGVTGPAFDLQGDTTGFWSDFNAFANAPAPFARSESIVFATREEWADARSLDRDSILAEASLFPASSEGDYRSVAGSAPSIAARYSKPVGPHEAFCSRSLEPIEGVEVVSTTRTSANIAYWTPGRRTGLIIEWGTSPSYGNRYDKADPGSGEYETFHTVSLLGLEPATKYHFRLGLRDYEADPTVRASAITWSEDFSFTTASEDPAPRELFVSPKGNDKADGLTPTTSWRTLAQAAREARAGDVVTLAPGRYLELLRPLQTGTAPDRRITFRAEKPLAVFLEGGNTKTFEGRSHCVQLMNKAFITLENLSFAGCYMSDNGGYRGGMGYGSLVLLSGAPGIDIRNCVMDGRGGYSIGVLALGKGRLPGVPADVPEVEVQDSLFLRTWWAAVVYSDLPKNSARLENNAFVRSLILMLSGAAPDHSMVLRNNIYQSLLPTKNRNRLFAKPAMLDSDFNCFAWDADNALRHVAYIDDKDRTYASSLAGWQSHFKQDAHSIEAEPGYPLSKLAGFLPGEKQDANRPLTISDLILPADSPCRGTGENGGNIGPRWDRFIDQPPAMP